MKNIDIYNSLPKIQQHRLASSSRLCEQLSYQFKKPELLIEALTHSSAAQELLRKSQGKSSIPWNERLEFLGDSVLGLVLSTHLFQSSSQFAEGDLSKIRAALVNEASLAQLARKLGLGECLLISSGEEKSGGRKKHSVLADAFEALLGAIYLDSNYGEVERVVMELYKPMLQGQLKDLIKHDYKSRLQELTQESFKEAPSYQVLGQAGPDHQASFSVAVEFRGLRLGIGKGSSKKLASQTAAKAALEAIAAKPNILTEGMTEMH